MADQLTPEKFDRTVVGRNRQTIIWTADAIGARIGCSADYVRDTLAALPDSPVKKIGGRWCAHEDDLIRYFRT